jgi:O-antigen/teichoic acid export membrane protein
MTSPRPVGMRSLLGWGILGQLVYVASQFVTLLALTRFATLQEVGLFGLVSAIVIPVFFFFDLSMRVNVAASGRSAYSFQDFRRLLILSASTGYALVVMIGLAAFEGHGLVLLLILGATKYAECISDFSYGVFQRFDRMPLVAVSLMLRSMGGAALFVVFLMAGASVAWAFAAQFIVWAVVAIGLDHARARRLWRERGAPQGADPARIRDLARTSFPLALNGLLAALQGNVPRYAIASLLTVAALGQFTVVAYAMQAISTIAMAAMQSLTARFSLFVADGRTGQLRHALRRILLVLALFTVVSVGVSLLVGDWLVQMVFGPDYADLGTLLAICVLAACLRSVVLALQMCLMAARRYRQNLNIRIGSLVAMVAACWAGGMLAGLSGIALGMCVAFVLHIAALAAAVRPMVSPAPDDRP